MRRAWVAPTESISACLIIAKSCYSYSLPSLAVLRQADYGGCMQ
jgi:hypothetical protein